MQCKWINFTKRFWNAGKFWNSKLWVSRKYLCRVNYYSTEEQNITKNFRRCFLTHSCIDFQLFKPFLESNVLYYKCCHDRISDQYLHILYLLNQDCWMLVYVQITSSQQNHNTFNSFYIILNFFRLVQTWSYLEQL